MNELADALAGSFQVSNHPNNPAAPHPRFSSYKIRPAGLADQDVRRQKVLERQKEKRHDFMNLARRLTEGDWGDGDMEDEEEEDQQMEVEVLIRKPGRHFKNQLMLSEWMIDRPPDLEQNWLMMPCPVGKRSLIIASRGRTCIYSKGGHKMNQFQSLLPGGNTGSRHNHSILDGIYVEAERTYYILDLMSWGNHPVYDSETEFRFFWMTCKFSEIPGLSEIGPQNKYKLIPIPSCQCTVDNITRVMATPMNTELDGLLFYHKAAHYLFGPTPLVLWLKGYMLPEILGVSIPQALLDKKPHEYVCFAHHIDKVTTERALQEQKRQRGQGSPGRRGRGRGHSRAARSDSQHGVMDVMDVGVMSLGGDYMTRGGAPSGKGRGRGRGRVRGRGQGSGHGRGQYQPQGGDLSTMDDALPDDTMEVSSNRRDRRRNRRKNNHAVGMEVIDTMDDANDTLDLSEPSETLDTS